MVYCIVLLSSSVLSRSFSFVLVRFSFVLVRFSFGSRSVLVRFSIGSRSVLDHPSFILRSFSVRESKIDRRTNGESSEARRRCIETLMGGQGKDDPNKNFIFNHLNSNYYGKTYSWLHHFSAPSHSAYSLYTAHVWWHEKRTRVSVFICNSSLFYPEFGYNIAKSPARQTIAGGFMMFTIDISLMRMLSDGMIISHWALRVLLSSARPFLLVFSSYLMCCMFC